VRICKFSPYIATFRCCSIGLRAEDNSDRLSTRKVVRGMRRVQNHFGIASSSVAPSEIDEMDHERIQKWMSETGIIVEEEKLPTGHPEGTNQPTAPGGSSANLDDGRGNRSSRPQTHPEPTGLPWITNMREESWEKGEPLAHRFADSYTDRILQARKNQEHFTAGKSYKFIMTHGPLIEGIFR
jgi:hypothetical protein